MGLLLTQPCQNGVWIVANDNCPYWGGDLNYLEGTPAKTTCINGGPLTNGPSSLINAPSGDWYFVEVFRHVNPANYFVIQRATGMTDPATNIVYQRAQHSDTPGTGWSDWSIDSNSCPYWAGDLNYLEGTPAKTTCINGSALTNAPSDDWYFVEVFRHVNPANYYVIQRATGMNNAATNIVYQRVQQSDTSTAGSGWGAWQKSNCGLGCDQQWQQTAQTYGVTYTNSGNKPIQVMAFIYATGYADMYMAINGIIASYHRIGEGGPIGGPYTWVNVSGIVPPGSSYIVAFVGTPVISYFAMNILM